MQRHAHKRNATARTQTKKKQNKTYAQMRTCRQTDRHTHTNTHTYTSSTCASTLRLLSSSIIISPFYVLNSYNKSPLHSYTPFVFLSWQRHYRTPFKWWFFYIYINYSLHFLLMDRVLCFWPKWRWVRCIKSLAMIPRLLSLPKARTLSYALATIHTSLISPIFIFFSFVKPSQTTT